MPFEKIINLYIPQDLISKYYLLSAVQFFRCLSGEFGIVSTNNPLLDISLYSYHLSA